ncbi:MIP/aquaporin family protein [Candidatus Laterigemmans baculatus]|nr:MIP/aquaporin family protein [Candidatus Laterigemmans baculatus]
MTSFAAELVGTAILILLGNGVVANVLLRETKGHAGGWIVITFGWGMAVFVAVFAVALYSGAHINPAVTIGLAASGQFEWAEVPWYLVAQFLGGALGAALVWLHYRPHFAATADPDAKLACFCTGPAIRSPIDNFISETLATFLLVFAVLFLAKPEVGLGALDALPVGLLVLVLGLSLGGTTGYAINPARDFAPRLMHMLLPIGGGKRDSDWGYAWIPVVGPIVGALLAAMAFHALGWGLPVESTLSVK